MDNNLTAAQIMALRIIGSGRAVVGMQNRGIHNEVSHSTVQALVRKGLVRTYFEIIDGRGLTWAEQI